MSVLGRYLSQRFLAYFLFVLTALAALALTLDLMEQADRVLASEHGGIPGLLRYAVLRLPDLAAQMLPASVLLGMLLVLGQLLRHREMVALWSSGVSPGWLMGALLPVVLGLAVLNYVNNDLAVPQTRAVLHDWGMGEARKSGFVADGGDVAWLLSGSDIVLAPRQAAPDGELRGATIFRRDADGRLLERLDARTAVPDGDGWLLRDVTRHQVDPAVTEAVPSLRWQGRIDLAALPLLASDMRELRSGQLIGLIENQGYGQRPPDRFRTWLHARIASAFLPALMIFLVIALAQRFRRTGGIGTLLLSSLGIGFAYFALDGICLALGESALLPPWFAAWSPKLALACVIGALLVQRES